MAEFVRVTSASTPVVDLLEVLAVPDDLGAQPPPAGPPAAGPRRRVIVQPVAVVGLAHLDLAEQPDAVLVTYRQLAGPPDPAPALDVLPPPRLVGEGCQPLAGVSLVGGLVQTVEVGRGPLWFCATKLRGPLRPGLRSLRSLRPERNARQASTGERRIRPRRPPPKCAVFSCR